MPRPPDFDRVADIYDETRGGLERGLLVADDLAPHLPPGNLLEIGVGTGLVAMAFAARGWRVTGVDLAPDMLSRAARRVPGRVVRGDAEALPFRAGSADGVLAVHVMHLVSDVPAVLAQVARVLRPGGRFAVMGGGRPAGCDVSDLRSELSRQLRVDQPERSRSVSVAAEPLGLRLVEDLVFERPADAGTPRSVREQTEARVWSSLWDVSPDRWAAVVVPTLEALRRLPDQDVPRVGTVTATAQIFER